tara:strand:+ start:572 stop:796 length:225 start_codon:yes stop_codon:yes gene_type:complete
MLVASTTTTASSIRVNPNRWFFKFHIINIPFKIIETYIYREIIQESAKFTKNESGNGAENYDVFMKKTPLDRGV